MELRQFYGTYTISVVNDWCTAKLKSFGRRVDWFWSEKAAMQRSSFIPNRTWLNKRSRALGCPNHLAWSPRQQATTLLLSHQGSTRVTGLHPKKVKQASKLYPAGTVTSWLAYAAARDHMFNHVRLGIKEERCIAAFSDQNQPTQRPKDYNIWANRGHPCFYKNEMALLVTFCIQIPI